MKTVKDLKDLVLAQEAKVLKIGSLEFRCDGEDQDVDVYINDKMAAWVSSGNANDTPLEEVNLNVDSAVFRGEEELSEVKSDNRKLRKANEKLEERLEAVKEQYDANHVALGKVEAYENILLGRDLTVSK